VVQKRSSRAGSVLRSPTCEKPVLPVSRVGKKRTPLWKGATASSMALPLGSLKPMKACTRRCSHSSARPSRTAWPRRSSSAAADCSASMDATSKPVVWSAGSPSKYTSVCSRASLRKPTALPCRGGP